jgi:hypothetical protein
LNPTSNIAPTSKNVSWNGWLPRISPFVVLKINISGQCASL